MADQIEAHLQWITNNPEAAAERALRGQRWFQDEWSLESKIKTVILPLYEQVLAAGSFAPRVKDVAAGRRRKTNSPAAAPICEVVIRTGGRDLVFLERALKSVMAASSVDLPVHVVVADYKGKAEVAALCDALHSPVFRVRYVRTPDTGFRSTALWGGILACEAEFVAHMDDDDTVFPNHYRQLVKTLKRYPKSNVAYSGVVLMNDEPDNYFKTINFFGPREEIIKEDRDLKFLDAFDLDRLSIFDNFIQSNTWLARRDFIQSAIGEDPELVVVEDVYLYLLMASSGPFRFTGSATALWHWRSQTDGDNSMFAIDQNIWAENGKRVMRRLARMPFLVSSLPGKLPGANDPNWETASHQPAVGLRYGDTVSVDRDFVIAHRCLGFHPIGEGIGLWSKETVSIVVVHLSRGAAEGGCVLLVTCAGAFDPEVSDQWIRISLSSGASVRLPVTDWETRQISLEIPPGGSTAITLSVTTSHFVNPGRHGSADDRDLGARIVDIGVVRTEELVPFPTSVEFGGQNDEIEFDGLGHYGLLAANPNQQFIVADGPATLFVGVGSTIWATHLDADEPVALTDEARASVWYLIVRHPNLDERRKGMKVSLSRREPDATFLGRWNRFASSIEGQVGTYTSAGVDDEQLSFVFGEKPVRGQASSDSVFVFRRKDDDLFWEVRSDQVETWKILAPLGSRTACDGDLVSRGRLEPPGAIAASAYEALVIETNPWLPDAARSLLCRTIYGLVREVLAGGRVECKPLALSLLIRMVA
ncbi:hypothetical protein BZG35_03855 [Brevundimonas sp. LM2]|uniref:glycosyltransferase family A protein n=1 Tax=Brevundimonas sp. LM2 TaxID=1938605 RepID=UPI000983CF3B|nr:glycosyltransferase family A protein [Brevundimonas sp. LM2]AQR60883.1 hypothetical protein BZG35_03855 [Brevundimonas sp. LM2]